MEVKKNPQIDLSKKRGLFLNIGLFTSLLLVTFAFEYRVYETGPGDLGMLEDQFEEELDVPLTQQPPPPPPPVFIPPEIIEVPDEEEIEEEIIDLDIDMSEDLAVAEVEYEEPEEDIDQIFMFAEVNAEPEGGIKAYLAWVQKHTRYPPQAKRMGLEGKVHLQFVIEANGSVSNIKVIRGIGGGCDEEAVRALKSCPIKWSPARQRGRPVRLLYTIPIRFRLSNDR